MNEIKLIPLYREVKNGNHKQENPITIPVTPNLIINPDLLSNYYPNMIFSELYGCNAYISCDSLSTIIIADFDYFSLSSFSNSNVILKYLKIYNAKEFCRLNGITAERLDIESSNCLIYNSSFNETNYGIEANYNLLRGEPPQNIVLNNKYINIDIRSSKIFNMTIHSNADKIILSDTDINKFTTKDNLVKIQIENFSEINHILLDKKISSIEINNSTVNSITGAKTLLLDNISTSYANILNAFKIFDSNILTKNNAAFELLRKSYLSEDDYSNYAKYSFLQKELIYKNKKGFKNKIIPFILRHTCGYGYKIKTAFLFSLKVILFFSLIYFLLSFFGNPSYGLNLGETCNWFSKVLNSLYHSIITFTTLGYGDTLGQDWITKFCSAIEAVLGIYSMSIIVFTITKCNITE